MRGTWEYDLADRPVKLSYRDKGGRTLSGWTYQYDQAGNCVRTIDADGQANEYRYDAAGELIEENGASGGRKYAYLPGGNRGSIIRDGKAIKYTYDAADQLVSAGGEKFRHDANGNLVERKNAAGTTRYEYDAQDRLVRVLLPDGRNVQYGYAPTGERISRRNARGIVYFVHNGLDVRPSGRGLEATCHVYPGPGHRLAAGGHAGERYYFHADRLGSIRGLSDETARLTAHYGYDAFGVRSEPATAAGRPLAGGFAFTGREWDAGAGLYYYRAQFYDPASGGFQSRSSGAGGRRCPVAQSVSLRAKQSVALQGPSGDEVREQGHSCRDTSARC